MPFLLSNPFKQYALPRADITAELEERDQPALDQMINLTAKLTIAVKEFCNGVRAVENVTRERR